MALFGGKKKKIEIADLPSPPSPKFPEISEIRSTIMPSSAPQSMPFKLEQPKQMTQPFSLKPVSYEESDNKTEEPAEDYEQEKIMPAPRIVQKRVTREVDNRESKEYIKPSVSKLKEPIFVKIDKFEEALATFEEVKKRLQESFELLERIRSMRDKEEEEISNWEKEIEEIKAKMFELDKELFSRVEF